MAIVRRLSMSVDRPNAKVALTGPDGELETLWATDLGDGTYRLENTPWYAYGVSWLDIVEAKPEQDGLLKFSRVVSKSGNRTVRIRADEPFTTEWLNRLVALGASFEGAIGSYIGVNIPPETDLNVVTSFLTQEAVEWEHADPSYEQIHGNNGAA
jgi:hypothetical protein